MNSYRNNPEGEENQQATRDNACYVGGLKLQQATLRACGFCGSYVEPLTQLSPNGPWCCDECRLQPETLQWEEGEHNEH